MRGSGSSTTSSLFGARAEVVIRPRPLHGISSYARKGLSTEIVKDPKTNEVTTTTISAELPHNRSPSSWIWFTSKKLCARAAIKLEPRMEDIE